MLIKEKLKWAFIVIFLEAIVLTAVGFYVYQNYLTLTKEKSKFEEIPATTLTLTWLDYQINEEIKTWKNEIYYKNMFWYIKAKKDYKWISDYNYEKNSYEKVYINENIIYKYCILNTYLEEGTIDIYIYNYFIDKEIEEFNIFLNNILKINSYLNLPIQEHNFDEKFCRIESLHKQIKKKKYGELVKELKQLEQNIQNNYNNPDYEKQVIWLDFFDTMEFQYLMNRFIIDKEWLYKNDVKKVADLLKVEKNIINSAVLTEQCRGFFTYRGYVKDIVKSNKVLMVMSQFSYGIWGIKEKTAVKIENYLSGNNQNIYIEYLSGVNNNNLRVEKLTTDIFIQLLYTGWLIKSIIDRRQQAGIDISRDYGVIFTLYNFGNSDKKIPHENPKIWGAIITINEKKYSFGALGMIFYYYLEMYY